MPRVFVSARDGAGLPALRQLLAQRVTAAGAGEAEAAEMGLDFPDNHASPYLLGTMHASGLLSRDYRESKE